jgi:iron(III) transport system ATP-binding protein
MVTVELNGVSKRFREVVAASDVSFHVQEGELFFLLGPSGCGKTTTLRIVAGFYKPDAGDVLFDGQSVVDTPPHRRNTGMVFQNYALWPHMTVYDNIAYGLKIRRVPMQDRVARAREVLRIVKMEDYATRYPNQLSGGQQQRVALARALVLEPDVLLLDEPLSNLDAKLRLETREEIKRIQKDLEITSIYVTHDQEEALIMADRLAIMNEGEIEQVGSPREVYNQPRNRFVAEFIGETNAFEGVVRSLEGATVVVESDHAFTLTALLQSPFSLREGQRVVCLVRPEQIVLHGEPGAVRNQIDVKIEGISYYGSAENYVLSHHGDLEIKATNFNPSDHQWRVGDTVHIHFPPDAVKLFPL